MKKTLVLEDLLLDETFLNYYFKSDIQDIFDWEVRLEERPEDQLIVNEALLLLDKLSLKFSPAQIKEKYLKLYNNLDFEENEIKPSYWFKNIWLGAAAVLALALFTGVYYFYSQNNPSEKYTSLINQSNINLVEKTNKSDMPLLINLSDGSSVMLHKNSRLSYPTKFSDVDRKVYLEGDAFFEIAKDISHPFYVYANDLATKVLGTSFMINAPKTKSYIKVLVKTGKVSIYPIVRSLNGTMLNQKLATVITQNQAVNYDIENARFEKEIVAEPIIIKQLKAYDFDFTNVNAKVVFEEIQKAYGIKIIYDENIFNHCPITASLSDEPLMGKIDLVCKAIEANYELIDGQVIITGKGCN